MPTASKPVTAPRNRQTGQWTFSRMERPCRCGHTLGEHSSGAPHDCLVGTFLNDAGTWPTRCECPKFRPAKATK